MNFKNNYKTHQLGEHYLDDWQMDLIDEIVREYDASKHSNPVESMPYDLSSLDTPIYLASINESQEIHDIRKEKEEKWKEKLCEYLKNLKRALSEEGLIIDENKDFVEMEKTINDLINPTNNSDSSNSNNNNNNKDGIIYLNTPLGWFDPKENEIFICLDKIYKLAQDESMDVNSLIANVVLHELSHARMYNKNHPCYKSLAEQWLEESLANKIMLNYLEHYHKKHPTSIKYQETLDFVEFQSFEYKFGVILKELNCSDWAILQNGKEWINYHNSIEWMVFINQNSNHPNTKVLEKLFYGCFLMGKLEIGGRNYSSVLNKVVVSIEDDVFGKLLNGNTKKWIYFHKNKPQRFGIIRDISLIPDEEGNKRFVIANNNVGWSDLKNNDYSNPLPSNVANIKDYKVIISEQINISIPKDKYRVNIRPMRLWPEKFCTDSFSVIASFSEKDATENKTSCEKCIRYLNSKLVKFLIAYFHEKKNTKRVSCYPILSILPGFDFTSNTPNLGNSNVYYLNWDCPINPQLYDIFQLTDKERRFIESIII